VPIKPQRVYQEMNKAFGPETRHVTTIGLSQIAAAEHAPTSVSLLDWHRASSVRRTH